MPATTASAEIAGASSLLSSRARSIIAAARSIASVRFSTARAPAAWTSTSSARPISGCWSRNRQQAAEGATQLTAPGRLAGDGLPHRQLDPGRPGVDRVQVAVFLVFEVVVEGLAVKARMGDRVLDGGLLVALCPHCLEHSFENALTLSGQSPRPV